MNKHQLLFIILFILVPCSTFSQQAKVTQGTATKPNMPNSSNSEYNLYAPDTSEQGMVASFRKMMDESETILDAQVISKKSYIDSSSGRYHIYTAIKFKVFDAIKGDFKGSEFTYNQSGGAINGKSEWFSPQVTYSLNERSIFFFKNKNVDKYLILVGRYQIFGAGNGNHGEIDLGTWQMDPEVYTKVMKQSLTDTTAYPKFIHMLKKGDERSRSIRLKYPNGIVPGDSVDRAIRQMKRVNSDTTKEGAR